MPTTLPRSRYPTMCCIRLVYILFIIGKTTSLRIALSLFGAASVHFKGGKSTLSSILSRASITTIPIGGDDINSAAHVEGLTVQFFNGVGHYDKV